MSRALMISMDDINKTLNMNMVADLVLFCCRVPSVCVCTCVIVLHCDKM